MIYYSRQITGDEETARDIVQESFMIYWKSRHNVSCDEKSIRNFLYVTVKHASLKWLRRQSIAEDYLNSRRNDSIEEPGVLNSLFRAEIIGRVQRVLEDLPDGCRRVTLLSYIEGKSNKEVASQLAISVNTVKTHKQRAIRYFRSCLSRDFYFLSP